ncbi:heterokaryon incompatibility protein-domain-containing protein [Massariosphaeria phaeospora]|uniref:Heterokaryon incompatibility protein-domain-containing protein n=1 Tax=Massariosphaeria phaeospora TaxID=100035 RepID=A0A7C8M9L6_9PLEO|nr:heterokaryon incompatibility protein-domain-containing protein [Massariosphaeria phaeospora]
MKTLALLMQEDFVRYVLSPAAVQKHGTRPVKSSLDMSQPLCVHCDNLAGAWLVPRMIELRDPHYPAHSEPIYWWTHSSWENLEASAQTCVLCRLVVDDATDSPKGPFIISGEDREAAQREGIRWQAAGSERLEIWCVERKKTLKLRVGFDRNDVVRTAYAGNNFHARVVSRCAGDEENIATLKHWLDVCRTGHDKCKSWALSQSQGRRLPTRVLDVGESSSDAVKLHVPADSDASNYIALSYCWGPSGNPYVTDRSNVDKHLATGIELGNLPVVLRDAVHLTRRLGMKYLWIDALCILQGDREDWIREASRMGAVYSNALLTISADASSETSTGLFLQRSARHGRSVLLPWPLTDPGDVHGLLNIHIMPWFRSFGDEMKTSPLAKRGWTFQERALSARILHFGTDMTYWECKEACIGEDVEIGTYSVQDGFFHLKTMLLPAALEEAVAVSKLHDKWAWLVSQFSSRNLTQDGDVFAALEGIASIFGAKEKLGKYICGLWEHEFHRHLLWFSDRSSDSHLHHRPSAYRAPSWSWAAVRGPVKNPAIETFFRHSRAEGIAMTEDLGSDGLLSHKILQVRQVKAEVEGPSAFGPVVEALLKVTGIFHRIKLGPDLAKGVYAVEAAGKGVVGAVVWDVDEAADRSVPLWLCPVMQRQKVEDGWAVSDGLVLRAAGVNHGGELTFERVGKGRATNFWAERGVQQDFVIL